MFGFSKHSSRKTLPTRGLYFQNCVPTSARPGYAGDGVIFICTIDLFGSHSSIAMESRGGVPPNQATLFMQSPAVHQQPRAFSHRYRRSSFVYYFFSVS